MASVRYSDRGMRKVIYLIRLKSEALMWEFLQTFSGEHVLTFLLSFTWGDTAESRGHLMLSISKYYLAVKVVYEDQVLLYTWPVHAVVAVLLLLLYEWISCKAWLVSRFWYILWISVMTNEVKLFLHELNIWRLLLPIIYSRLLPMFILSFPFFSFYKILRYLFTFILFIFIYECVIWTFVYLCV